MDATTQWKEDDGDSSHTYFEPSAGHSPPPVPNADTWTYLESTSSQFGSVECGEPMVPQHLVLDFSLREDPASEEAQQKVRDFWEFLAKHPELEDMVCVNDEQELTLDSMTSASPELGCSEGDTLDQQTTALSTLCLYETTGAIDRAFHTRMKNTVCDLELPSYLDRATAPLKNICVPDASSGGSSEAGAAPSSEELGRLTRALWTWDERHPKSMEPPGHPALLAHAELVRRVDHQCDDYDSTLRRNDPYNY